MGCPRTRSRRAASSSVPGEPAKIEEDSVLGWARAGRIRQLAVAASAGWLPVPAGGIRRLSFLAERGSSVVSASNRAPEPLSTLLGLPEFIPIVQMTNAEAIDDLRLDLVQKSLRPAVSHAIPDPTPFLPTIDYAALPQDREMAGHVLLRRAQRIGKRLHAHLPVGLETQDHPDAKRLSEGRQAMSEVINERFGDRIERGHEVAFYPPIGPLLCR